MRSRTLRTPRRVPPITAPLITALLWHPLPPQLHRPAASRCGRHRRSLPITPPASAACCCTLAAWQPGGGGNGGARARARARACANAAVVLNNGRRPANRRLRHRPDESHNGMVPLRLLRPSSRSATVRCWTGWAVASPRPDRTRPEEIYACVLNVYRHTSLNRSALRSSPSARPTRDALGSRPHRLETHLSQFPP